jgi:GTP cyclohydrolase II
VIEQDGNGRGKNERSPNVTFGESVALRRGPNPTLRMSFFHVWMPNRDVTGVAVSTAEGVQNRALVRIHSACLTSEVFGDSSCDCSWQLNEAINLIAQSRNGLLLYVPEHEGRSHGLEEKLSTMAYAERAGCSYELAMAKRGLRDDLRTYDFAARALTALSISSVKLLTRNNNKVAALRRAGIQVSTIPLDRLDLSSSNLGQNGQGS